MEHASIRRKAVQGSAWLAGGVLATRLLAAGAQVVLAWLLTPEFFGLAALAQSFAAVILVLGRVGPAEVLLQSGDRFRELSGRAFVLISVQGLLAGLAVLAAAPLTAAWYGDARLVPLVMCLAPTALLAGTATIPRAWLRLHLRFKLVAGATIASQVVSLTLMLLLAYSGFGAYSLLLPIPVGALIEAGILWLTARPPVVLGRHSGAWREFLPASVLVALTTVVQSMGMQVDNIALGTMRPKYEVGIYYFAYNLSTQAHRMLTLSMLGVLFPALVRLGAKRTEQSRTFVRGTEILALVNVPLCLLQALSTRPLIHLLFASKWYPAIPVIEAMSYGWAVAMVGAGAHALLKARGMFGKSLSWEVAQTLAIGLSALVAASLGGFVLVGRAVALAYAAVGLALVSGSLRLARFPQKELWNVLGVPAITSLGALGTGFLVRAAFRNEVLRLAIPAMVFCVVYLLLLRLLSPAGFARVFQALKLLTRKRSIDAIGAT